MNAPAALLLLADARLPSGGHAHSAGTEAAIGVGDVRDLGSLGEMVRSRLETSGFVDAAFSAAICHRCTTDEVVAWRAFADEHRARTASPRLRDVSEQLGRQLLRAAGRAWPSGRYAEAIAVLGAAIPQPVAMGLAGHAAGCAPRDTALAELHHFVGSITTAAVRLLGLDPFDVAALAAAVSDDLERLAAAAATAAHLPPDELPADVHPFTDVLAEHHTTWEVRLFAS